MRWLPALVLVIPSLAAAQPGATDPIALPVDGSAQGAAWLAQGAHDAAVKGDCATAQALAGRVARLDPAYHAAVVATDATITSCVYVPPVVQTGRPPVPAEPSFRMEVPSGSPKLSGGRLTGEFFLGGLFSLGGALGGGYIGYLIDSGGDSCADCDEDFDGLGGALIGGSIGLVLGASAGVALAGSDDTEDYSFGATLGGATVGGLVGIAIAAAGEGEDFVIPLIVGPTLGAMIGFNLSRSFKPRPVPMRATYPLSQRELIPPTPKLGGDHANLISLGTYAF